MMLMSDHDDAYVDAMLMGNMQANTRSVTQVMYCAELITILISMLLSWFEILGDFG